MLPASNSVLVRLNPSIKGLESDFQGFFARKVNIAGGTVPDDFSLPVGSALILAFEKLGTVPVGITW